MLHKYPFLFLSILFLVDCENSNNEKTLYEGVAHTQTKGKFLMRENCLTCHQLQENESNKLAPSISALRFAYRSKTRTRLSFENAIVKFVSNPSSAHLLMPGAIQHFGPMPKMDFPEKTVRSIAKYIYETPFEKTGFEFKDYSKVEKQAAINTLPFKERGFKYALSTKKLLGKNLIGKLQTKGTSEALSFCNENAINLTQKKSDEYGVGIKRVSDKPRNPKNQANERELLYIQNAKKALAQGNPIKPSLFDDGTQMVGYYPIETKQMCMQCHGNSEEIKKETLMRIEKLYPNDKAKGYKTNELRGIWVVEMPKL